MQRTGNQLMRAANRLIPRVVLAAGVFILAMVAAAPASAAVQCPNPVPVVNENNCMGAGSTAWHLSNGNGNVAGFSVQPSYNLGQNVVLKIGGGAPDADLQVFRMGYYGGTGARLILTANNVPLNNGLGCNSPNGTTGEIDCTNWDPTYTIAGSALPASGVYLVKVTDSNGNDNDIIFIVRDDNHTPGSQILVKIPFTTYEAYNSWGGKSLYNFNSTGSNLANGFPRAFAVSFERPFIQPSSTLNDWFLNADYPMVYWLEKEGYDVSYTSGEAIDQNPNALLNHKIFMICGHDEYWSGGELAAVKNARDHGVNIASFSGNTAYWKVEYEGSDQTVADYKTVQDGTKGINDPGPGGPTTTFRDPGAPAGSPNAPPGGRVGPNTPENALLGSMYVGDTLVQGDSYGLTVPPADSQGEFSGNRIWRNTGINPNTGATIGTNFVGWEWDAVPGVASYLGVEPPGVVQLSQTNVENQNTEFIQDYGMVFGPTPQPGQSPYTQAVEYRAASGALVFAAGTMQWSWGLGPHYGGDDKNFLGAATDNSDSRIQQATYNVLSDMGVQPNTPIGITLDSQSAPYATFKWSPGSASVGQSVAFDASGSSGGGGTVTDYKWDFDGSGQFATDSGTSSSVSHTFNSTGSFTVSLKVINSNGQATTTSRTVSVGSSISTPYAQAVLKTSGIAHYWRLGDSPSSTQLADAAGGSPATISGGVTLGQPGALSGDPTSSAAFNGVSGAATAPVDLSSTGQVTIEFWMKRSSYANDDQLAMEFTPNFNQNAGGFLVDPDAPDVNGSFGVGIGINGSRNNAFFARPSAGAWHYYAFVINTAAPGASQITPYVDGVPVSYTKTASGTGAGVFTSSNLYLMSRDASSLFANGSLQDVAIYTQDLSAATIAQHYSIGSGPTGPRASFTYSPASPSAGQTVTLDGSSSSDGSGTIVDYKWDLDGSGQYATDTGTTPSVSKAFSSPGQVTIGLKITDSNGAAATTTQTITVGATTNTPYAQAVMGTAGLVHYWRLGDPPTSSAFADAVGGSPASIFGGVTPGQPGALAGDPTTSAAFDGVSGTASAPVNLSSTSQVTIEFWMKRSSYANDDQLAMEFTPNFNQNAGGFLVDPDAPDVNGSFGVGIGMNTTRNNVFFARPSAGAWHYYAFVVDTTAAAGSEITPYVDGVPVSYTKTASGTGAGAFANSILYLMSRGGSSLFGKGSLQDVALYNQDLSAATIQSHYNAAAPGPSASFTYSPSTVSVGQNVSFDASQSSGGSGSITDYKWDFDGSGQFATDSGTSSTSSHKFTTPGQVKVSMEVTNSKGQTATTSQTITIGAATNTPYAQAVMGTAGLVHYWRLGDPPGSPAFTDAAGGSPGAISGGVTLGQPGALPGDPTTSAAFDGVSGTASAPVNLSSTSQVTIEFWMKRSSYANDDQLAMEFTPNFNQNAGGFLVDPDAPDVNGSFGVGIGMNATRNNAFFARPSAGAWHYYAFVINTAAPGASQITPYVDGVPVSYTKTAGGTGAGPFANSILYLMSRGGSSLFGNGSLQDVAVYNQDLSAATIQSHYNAAAPAPSASFTYSPSTVFAGQSVTFNGSGSTGAGLDYKWDFDGSGQFATDSGSSPTIAHTFTTPGQVKVSLKVTNSGGQSAATAQTVTVGPATNTPYAQAVLGTPGLVHYWRLGDASGSTSFADPSGGTRAAISGGVTLGQPGALASDPTTSAAFDGVSGSASAPVNLSSTSQVTIEFWMKRSSYANDDQLAMEFTPNFNQNAGGFLVDPDAPDVNGSFGVGIGQGASRNSVFFARPSAGAWHYYAFVVNTTAPAGSEITPYVDGVAVPFTQTAGGTGAGAFANSVLYLMSRGGSSLFGNGNLQDVAIYNQDLSAATVQNHYAVGTQ